MKSQYSVYRQLYLREWQVWNQWPARIAKESTYMDIEIDPHYSGPNGFVNFIDDMGPRPSPRHELQRLDKFEGYKPGNLIWRERRKQVFERRKHQSPDEFTKYRLMAEKNGILYATYWNRVKRGWSYADAATLEPKNAPYKSRLV
jgi:hypothetical protein